MKKIVLAAIICIVRFIPAVAQPEGEKSAPFQFSFLYPLGTNGIHSPEYTNTVSVNMLAGISRNEKAFTLGGLANIIRHDAAGFQTAGIYNHIGNEGKGILLSGLANHTGYSYEGIQLAGLANITGNMKGVQIAGLVNVAKEVEGVQFAGLVNVAEKSDYPIALLNFIKNGEKSVSLSYSETGSALVSFRSGGRVTYGIVGYGYNHRAGGNAFVTEGGLGAHIRCSSRFRINNEMKTEMSISKKATFKAGYHILPAYRITPRLEIFFGPGIHYIRTEDVRNVDMLSGISLWKKQGDAEAEQIHIGYSLGIQFIL
jgi:hypothetical protein